MPYIDRNKAGNIVGIYANAQREGHEFVEAAELWVAPPSPLAQIEALEQNQIKRTARAIREERLKEMEAYAQTTLGLNPAQLYAAASLPNAATALKSYKELKDLGNQIAALRAML